MKFLALAWAFSFALGVLSTAASPELGGITSSIQASIDAGDITGAVTIVVTKDKVPHEAATGLANIERKEPMQIDSLFWIASMTKPITATAVLMLEDEGKLNVDDPVAKYIPEFAQLKTPSGKLASITLSQALTHTSGLGEASARKAASAKTLADMIPLYLASPMQFEPGTRWKYTQSGINVCARIVEIVSGKSFDQFVQERIFSPLGMSRSTFYPGRRKDEFPVTGYTKDKTSGRLVAAPPPAGFSGPEHPPFGNAGVYSTGPDYARFCQMLLGGGVFQGHRYLSPKAWKEMTTVRTGDLPTGFLQAKAYGSRGANYGWGIGTCILKTPHEGVAEMLSPGTFGHGGAWGTQAWVDPVKGVAYILMIQRPSSGNGDASELRRSFQNAAALALSKL